MPKTTEPFDVSGKMPDPENNRDLWLAWRRAGLGGSELAAVAGLSPFKNSLDVYNDKLGVVAPDDMDSGRMKRGRKLEQNVVEEFCELTGCKVRRAPAIPSKDFPFMRSTIDRQILTGHGSLTLADGSTWTPERPGVFEAKTTTDIFFRKICREGPTDGMVMQCAHNCIVWDYDYAVLAILCPESWDFRYWVITLDDTLAVECVELARSFWEDHVAKRVPPTLTTTKAPPKIPEYTGDVHDFGDDPAWSLAIGDYEAALRLKDDAESLLNASKRDLQDMMDTAEAKVAEGAGYRWFWTDRAGSKSFSKPLVVAWISSLLARLGDVGDDGQLLDVIKEAKEQVGDKDWVADNFHKTGKPSRPFRPFDIR